MIEGVPPELQAAESGERLIVDALLDTFTDVPEVFNLQVPLLKDGKSEVVEVPFKVLSDNVAYNETRKFVAKWVTEHLALAEKGILHPTMSEYFIADEEMLGRVALLHHLCQDPQWKPAANWLKLARKASPAFMAFYNSVTNAAVPSISKIRGKVFEDEKKD